MKTFAFPIDARNPTLGERLVETRFLVKEAGGFVASTYVWNEEQTDALVSTGDLDVPVHWIDQGGRAHEESFHVPGTSECASCHQNRALGWRARQLDHSGSYADGSQGQIAHAATASTALASDPTTCHRVCSRRAWRRYSRSSP